MAAKTPDSVEERVVAGSRSLFILVFSTTTVATGDTVDLSPYCTSVVGADFVPTTAVATGVALSGAGNQTATIAVASGTPVGRLFVWGTP